MKKLFKKIPVTKKSWIWYCWWESSERLSIFEENQVSCHADHRFTFTGRKGDVGRPDFLNARKKLFQKEKNIISSLWLIHSFKVTFNGQIEKWSKDLAQWILRS